MTISDALSDFWRMLKGTPPTYVPPQPARFYAAPRPVPIAVPPANTPAIPSEQPQASLVGTRDHARGRLLDGGGLVGGR